MAVLHHNFEKELNATEVLNILSKPDEEKVSCEPPQRPTGGQLFVYPYENLDTKDDWVADGYRFVKFQFFLLAIK